MSSLLEIIRSLPMLPRVLAIFALAVAAHLLVLIIRALSTWLVAPKGTSVMSMMRRHPKFVTVTTIFVSASTFAIYFAAIGFVLTELGVSLTAYLASASVIGLAVGFGLQGLVQDVVIGLTVIFSDVLDVGDVVDLGGQTGRVERVGLRFTVLVNVHDQRVFVPNRNITQIGRYRGGHVRAFVDLQLPEEASSEEFARMLEPVARALRRQHSALIVAPVEFIGTVETEESGWRFYRIMFKMWPGQGALVEQTFRQRAVAILKQQYPDYADWMVTVTYRVRREPASETV